MSPARPAPAYDVLIIGAGHNGLTAAAYLARAGRRVLVLERRPVLGGAAATEPLWPGYQVNTGAGDAALFEPAIVRELELGKFGLAFLEPEAAVFAPRPDGRPLTLWRDPARNPAEIAGLSPADAGRYLSFVSEIGKWSDLLAQALRLPPPEPDEVSAGALMPWLRFALGLRRRGRAELLEFLRLLPLPVKEFLDEWFENDFLKATLAAPAVRGGLPGVHAAGSTFSLLYQARGGGAPRPVRGGLGRLSLALAEAARRHGAQIRTDADVAEICLDDEEAVRGLRLASGEEIAAQQVMSAADPKHTLLKLVGGYRLGPANLREARAIRYRGTSASVHLALAGLPHFEGAADPRQLTGRIQLAPSLDYLERAHDAAKYGRISNGLVLEACIPTLLDPSLAPAGRHLMSMTVQYAPYELTGADWGACREALADQVVAALDAVAPGLAALVHQREVITPADYETTYGLTAGDIHHGQMGLDQLLSLRPMPGFARYRLPIPGLYLAGAGAHPGGGVTGLPGRLAAAELLRDKRPAG
ncbi:MAG: phytoene desaturase family protein [Candidatus Promineifilaceae bacterium]